MEKVTLIWSKTEMITANLSKQIKVTRKAQCALGVINILKEYPMKNGFSALCKVNYGYIPNGQCVI